MRVLQKSMEMMQRKNNITDSVCKMYVFLVLTGVNVFLRWVNEKSLKLDMHNTSVLKIEYQSQDFNNI